jgi:hypothetical protein
MRASARSPGDVRGAEDGGVGEGGFVEARPRPLGVPGLLAALTKW